ncbi:unnamed protein product, partial [Dibothriocephalus latus]
FCTFRGLTLKCRSHPSRFPSYKGILTTAQQRNEVVVTGIQPTGIPHLGNYLGMIKPVVKLQSSDSISRIIILIADLHALTCHQPALQLNASIINLAAALLSCGLDPMESVASSQAKKTVLFLQSSVPEHCVLSWLLSSTCSVNVRVDHLFVNYVLDGTRAPFHGPVENILQNTRVTSVALLESTDCVVRT